MATPYHLTKKRGALKGTRISFLRDSFRSGLSQWRLRWECQGLSFVLDLSDQMCTFVLHRMLFMFVCLFMFDGMLHNIVVCDILLFVLVVKIFP